MQRHVSLSEWANAPRVEHVIPGHDWHGFSPKSDVPFSKEIVSFCGELSTLLLKQGQLYPDLSALGFWLRPAQLKQQQQRLTSRRALGLVLHMVPSNVPTVAFYSWLISLLMGNSSVIRLSSNQDPVQNQILRLIQQLFSDAKWQGIAARTRFIRYPYDDGITSWLSERCMMRVLWGGDTTVRQLRAIPLAPRAQELVFANRNSIAVLDVDWLGELSKSDLDQQLLLLGQDCTRFNQQACSSPTRFIWVGTPSDELKAQVYNEVFKPFANEPTLAMDRLINSQLQACEMNIGNLTRYRNCNVITVSGAVAMGKAGGGLLAETSVNDITELSAMVLDVQTCVWLASEEKKQVLLENACELRFDRIVKPGKALAFEWYWDGVDLLTTMSRLIS